MQGFRRRTDVPDGAFIQPVRVRSYEVGRHGQLTAGTVLRYLEATATEHSAYVGYDIAWYAQQGTAWVVRDMQLRLGASPAVGEELLSATWVSDYRRVQAQREYAVWCAGSMRPVARATARWAYVDTARGLPHRIYEGFGATYPLLRHRFAAPVLPPPPGDGALRAACHRLALTAREYEMDVQGHINNCVYVDWLTEAVRAAVPAAAGREGGWWRPRDLSIEYLRPTQAGDALTVVTRTAAHTARGLWAWQEVVRAEDGATCVRARAHYVASHP